jgi:nitrogen fixation/metabolism regulation signal transduction histidine kinase
MFTKLKVYIIMFAAFAMFAGIAYWYYQDTQKALMQYAQNQAKLETSLTIQKSATESLQNSLKVMSETITQLNKDFAESRQKTKELETMFNQDKQGNKRDFGELTIEAPEYIEGQINKGSNEVFRCVELLSGQEAKEGEADDKEYIDCITSGNGTDSMQ